MGTQPWISTKNPNGEIWFSEVRYMLSNGTLKWDDLKKEIELGYFRPSLLRDIKFGHLVPRFLKKQFNGLNDVFDKTAGFVPHAAVYEAKRERVKAIREFEKKLQQQVVGEQ